MIPLHEGLDYRVYKIYIWGGLAGILIYSFILLLMDIPQTGNTMLLMLGIPISVWLLGILAYWWWVFVFKGKKELKEAWKEPPDRTPEISNLKNLTTLHTAMMMAGGKTDDVLEYEKQSRRPVIIWYGMQNLLVLWVLGNFWVWTLFQEHLPVNYVRKIWAPGVVVILILFLVLTPLLVFRAKKGGMDAFLKPLGLSVVESSPDDPFPSDNLNHHQIMIPEGSTLLMGNRRGRRVFIEAMGKQSYTWIQSNAPAFEILSHSGKLNASENAPEAVKNVIKELRKAKRWKGIKVAGDSEGIKIERKSRGQNMWLYDLWLSERLFESMKL